MLTQLKAQVTAHFRDLVRRGSDLLEAKLKLVEAKYKLALSGLQRVGASLGIYALAGIVALVGFFTAVAAGCVALAAEFGVPIALAITGGALMSLAVVAVLIGKSILHGAEQKAKRQYESDEHEAKLQAAQALRSGGPIVPPDHLLPPGHAAGAPVPNRAHSTDKTDNTMIAISAIAFAVTALVGPQKATRMIKRSASAAAKTAVAIKLARKAMNQNGSLRRSVASAFNQD